MKEKDDAILLIEQKPKSSRTRPVRSRRRGPTGPRSKRGKERSRYNALRHGIFAVGILPRREFYSDYQALVESLMDCLHPVGRLEEILVEKLAMLFWRYRRLIGAEAALVSNAAEAVEEKDVRRQMRDGCVGGEEGLLHKANHTDNPYASATLVNKLEKLHQTIEQEGLDWDRDQELLIDIFGYRDSGYGIEPRRAPLVKKYRELTLEEGEEGGDGGEGGEGEPQEQEPAGGKESSSPAEAKKKLLDMIKDAVELFAPEAVTEMLRKGEEERLSAIAALVPRGDIGDRLQQYEGTLERSIDRTLTQLERLQRTRAGQPLPPPVRIDVAS